MRTRNITLTIAGVVIVAGCAMHVNQLGGDPRTRYVVRFDAPTMLASKAKFIEALGKTSWRRGIAFTPPEPGDPSPDDDNSPVTSTVTQTLLISQASAVNPDSLRVTQRLGFNKGQEKELNALLKQIKE